MEQYIVERGVKTERNAKSRIKRGGQARLVCQKTYTATSPPHEGEPAGTTEKKMPANILKKDQNTQRITKNAF